MRELSLPIWAELIGQGVVEVDAAVAYPALLQELGVKADGIDQYWLAVAFNCMKRDIEFAVAGTNAAPKVGGALRIHVRDDTKGQTDTGVSVWALAAHPAGKGEIAGVKEFKTHYGRIRPGLMV